MCDYSKVKIEKFEIQRLENNMKSLTLHVFNENNEVFSNEIESDENFGKMDYLITKDNWSGWIIPVINQEKYNFHFSHGV